MHPQLSTLADQWRDSLRLRLGLLAILLILGGYLIDAIHRQNQALAQEYIREQERLQRLEQLQNQAEWQDWAQAARERRLEFEQTLWQAESRGLARARIQSWLRLQLKRQGLDHLLTRTEEAQPQPGPPPLWRVDTEINGDVNESQLLHLLDAIELAEDPLRVDTLDLTKTRNGYRLQLRASAWFLAPQNGESTAS